MAHFQIGTCGHTLVAATSERASREAANAFCRQDHRLQTSASASEGVICAQGKAACAPRAGNSPFSLPNRINAGLRARAELLGPGFFQPVQPGPGRARPSRKRPQAFHAWARHNAPPVWPMGRIERRDHAVEEAAALRSRPSRNSRSIAGVSHSMWKKGREIGGFRCDCAVQ